MIYALGKKLATPGDRGECPACGGDLIAKCGEIVCHHWAHKTADCDPWSEPETDWHVGWKNCFPVECQEVVYGDHRADVMVGMHAIEFQHSPISPSGIRDREDHYDQLTWVIDGSGFAERFRVFRPDNHAGSIWREKVVRYRSREEGSWMFTWVRAKTSFFYGATSSSLVVDLGLSNCWKQNGDYPTLFLIDDWDSRNGQGRFISRNAFVSLCLTSSFRIKNGCS